MKVFDSENCVGKLNEKSLINRVREIFGDTMPLSPFGAGDDCALIKRDSFSQNIYATSDSVIMDVHFTRDTSAELAGAKLMKRNISDIAAMGAVPFYALTSAVFSKNLNLDWLDKFSKGLADSAREYGVQLIGGDMASVKEDYFSMHLTLLGSADTPPLLRSGAKLGDIVCTTGFLGASFETQKHLNFTPRLKEGLELAKDNSVSACLDISDGIASDILNILPKNTSFICDVSRLPLNNYNGEKVSIHKALCDGEDYELLFTYRGDISTLSNKFHTLGLAPISVIGKIVESSTEDKILLEYPDKTLLPFKNLGYSH